MYLVITCELFRWEDFKVIIGRKAYYFLERMDKFYPYLSASSGVRLPPKFTKYHRQWLSPAAYVT